ncbi:MAG: hypothetical protein HY706_13890 [Candidatus Hydrogenedentes bacterium]|nr:hypothetical protein [Candidatus Hydrogenedentota bacterium]
MWKRHSLRIGSLIFLSVHAHGAVWYVDKDNSFGIEDGATWNRAFTAVQAGIDAAFAAGGGEVWVAEGIYDELRSSPNADESGQDTGSIVMRPGVHLFGGFIGIGLGGFETLRWRRDGDAHGVTLDGSKARGGLAAHHVVVGANDATLDGFIITGGAAQGSDTNPTGSGGGMYNSGASPNVVNCRFAGNLAFNNAGMSNGNGASPQVTNCLFTGDGTLTRPWRTISTVLAFTAGIPTQQFLIKVGEGTYSEQITLSDNALLVGNKDGSTVIQAPTVVVRANGGQMRHLVIQQTADDPSPVQHLVEIESAFVVLRDVTFEGSTPQSVGLYISGAASSGSLVTDCSFRNLGIGIEAVGSTPRIRRCSFDQLGLHGLVVRSAAQKVDDGSLGDVTDANSGYNVFGETGGAAVVNETGQPLNMQNNYWGTDDATAEQVAGRIEGEGNFEPFLNKSIIPATLIVNVWNAETILPVNSGNVQVSPGAFSTSENTEGVYVFACLPAESYTVSVSALGYVDSGPMKITVSAGETKSVSAPLMPDAVPPTDSDGDGLSDSDEDGVYYTDKYKADTDDDGVNDDVEIAFSTDPTTSDQAQFCDIDAVDGVNAVDVQLVINAALGLDIAPYNGDVDLSGETDAIDVQLVINTALGLSR